MNKILLNFYGYKVFIADASGENIIDKIKQDFSYFIQSFDANDDSLHDSSLANRLFIKVNCPEDLVFTGLPLGKTKLCKVKQASLKKRLFNYYVNEDIHALASLIDDKKNKMFTLQSKNSNLAFEIIYLLILSSVGENLESRGLMRLHACSFLFNNKSFCFWGHRHSGKSTLALSLMDLANISIYSDENTLYDLNTGQVLPFPIRMSVDINTYHSLASQLPEFHFRQNQRFFLDDKLLVDIPINKHARPKSLDFFYILGARGTKNKLLCFKLKDYFFLFLNIILSVGTIQMTEFFIRPTNLPILIKILINRIQLFFRILKIQPRIWARDTSLNKNISYCANSILNR